VSSRENEIIQQHKIERNDRCKNDKSRTRKLKHDSEERKGLFTQFK